jgi:hypothetical protein
MRWRLGDVITENSGIAFSYLIASWADTVKSLTWCANAKYETQTDTGLDDLVKLHMKLVEDRLEESLGGFYFNLDSPESLLLVCQGNRLEKVGDDASGSEVTAHLSARRIFLRSYS